MSKVHSGHILLALARRFDWFVWDKQHQGETVLRMLDRADARQAEMFGAAA